MSLRPPSGPRAASTPSPDLPEPAVEEQERSARLTAVIRREIEIAGGALDFSRFMALALHAPGLGYYTSEQRKFGMGGDFVTAPELGDVFARCLAHQCREILDNLPAADILEAGAGSGALAADILLELERLGSLPRRYFILELSTALRAHQRETLQHEAPHLAERVRWLDTLPATFRGIVLGNELLDAMPVERFRVADRTEAGAAVQGDTGCGFADRTEAGAARRGTRDCGFTERGVRQLQVTWADDRFVWCERDADDAIRADVEALRLPAGYTSEINTQAAAWVRSIADIFEAGVILLADYGFPRAEFYHPQRAGGTLMCHYRHRAHTDPLMLVGLQDITAHIDFTAIARAAQDSGLKVLGYTSQAMFLLGSGLDEIAAASDPSDARAHARLAHEISRLTSPAEMGELFKVIALGRGVAAPLRGFAFQDRRDRL